MIISDQITQETPLEFIGRPIMMKVEENQKFDCVLLVDDDRATNFLNKRLLDRMGIVRTICVARNGEEAMEYLMKALAGERDFPTPDIILLDINMPLVNGWEFMDRYEEMPDDFKNSTAIYMLSTSLRESDLTKAEEHPLVRGFLPKPLTAEQVMKFT